MDLGGFALDRLVVVQGQGQGSGVLLDPCTVLTARHVVGDRDSAEVIHPFSGVPVSCKVRLTDPGLDAVLLAADSMVIGGGRAARLGLIRYGRVATGAPLPHCQIVGFPEIQRYGDHGEDLEYDQYGVSVLPMAGRLRDLLVCQVDQPAAAERGRGDSPLAGLSGAPVFAGGVLLGVVTQVPRDRHHLRIEAVPVETLLRDQHFEDITDVHPQDELFEARYAADLSARYRKTEIFGIEELGRSESRWDLDTAYLGLEASGGGSGPQRIDALLADRPRTLLRGEAGACKTTLVWWLAAHAANGTLGPKLQRINRLVPFVVPRATCRHAEDASPRCPSCCRPAASSRTTPPRAGRAGCWRRGADCCSWTDSTRSPSGNGRRPAAGSPPCSTAIPGPAAWRPSGRAPWTGTGSRTRASPS